ncbi:MAG: M23 family metallopeptidase [Cyanobacteria bacterium P01_B01_bin.77]
MFKPLLGLLGLMPLGLTLVAQASPCPEAALAQVVNHRTGSGESLNSVASQYGLLPTTLMAMNPTLSAQGMLRSGQVVAVPPFNGTVVQVGAGQTWQSLAERHGTRADLLFEVNGCPSVLPRRVFIPGPNRIIAATVPTTLNYPLPTPAPVILSYGWQPHPQKDELVFNSGIALAAVAGTGVTSAANGTVAFVGEHNGAVLVVVNHRDGLQTRYGNLDNVTPKVGDVISEGGTLGVVSGQSTEASESFVYFEIRTNSREGWVAQDPGLYLSELELQR